MFGKLFKAAVNTVTLPVDVVEDVVTLGGTLNDADEPSTVRKIKKIKKQIDEAGEED